MKRNANGRKKSKQSKYINDNNDKDLIKNEIEWSGCRVSHAFQDILYMGTLGGDLCVVERPLLKMLEGLPASFYKKTFGA